MKLRLLLVVLVVLINSGTAHADLISDWNEAVIAAGYRAQLYPVPNTRNVAMVQVAMFEAINAIAPRYKAYALALKPAPDTGKEAATITTAHELLRQLYPEQSKSFADLYQKQMSEIADGAGKLRGVEFGKQIAAEMLKLRAGDNIDAVENYEPEARPGAYVPTVIPLGTTCGNVTPWALKHPAQFRPGPPYKLASEQYARDFNEVKAYGGKTQSKRSEEQTAVAKFWEFTGPGTYSPIARQWASRANLDLVDSARLFALFAMATADSYLAVFDAKYQFNFWRPITAIRNGAKDDNRDTLADNRWLPLLDTPLHPEYPCAHCIASTTAAGVLEKLFGRADYAEFELRSPTAANQTRRYANLNDYVQEIMNARIWGGIHFRSSALVANKMGKQIAEFVLQNYLTPR